MSGIKILLFGRRKRGDRYELYRIMYYIFFFCGIFAFSCILYVLLFAAIIGFPKRYDEDGCSGVIWQKNVDFC